MIEKRKYFWRFLILVWQNLLTVILLLASHWWIVKINGNILTKVGMLCIFIATWILSICFVVTSKSREDAEEIENIIED